jgi:fido (protein-threonine AMPylation protein)
LSRHSEEIAYLKRLIGDFPSDFGKSQASKAFQRINTRYKVLENEFILKKSELFNAEGSEYIDATLSNMKELSFSVHRFMFNSILSNAGEMRKSSDPKDGHIYFGETKHQGHKQQFQGTPPSRINAELDTAFAHLISNADKPIRQAMRFFQHFVYIHPFYDGNGRIGRVIVSTYLYQFDYYVLWMAFDGPGNTQFINKLNECHKRMKSGFRFDNYFGYLLNFFKKHVVSVDELNDLKK